MALNAVYLDDRHEVERAILGGLKSQIHEHGPINGYWRGSATKRIFQALKQYKRQRDARWRVRRRYCDICPGY